MGLRPLHDWVLLRRSEPEEKTGGGIIIPDAAKSKPTEGIVEAIGPGRFKEEKGKKEKKFVPTVLRPGQRVMFIDYMAKDVTLDGNEITLIREEDILGTIEGPGALVVKKPFALEMKEDRPPMVQAEPEKAKVETRAGGAKPGEQKKGTKTGIQSKKTSAQEKPGTVKKPEKTAAKKAAPKKMVKKAAAKKATTKKTAVKKTTKKAVVKKTEKAAKKTVKKSTAKKSTPGKAAVPKRTVVKKKTAKKTAGKAKR